MLRVAVVPVLVACAFGPVDSAGAAELWSQGDASIRIDTTIQFSTLHRLTRPQARVLGDPNTDDGDRAFSSGAISNRTDVFSELDADYGAFGIRASAAAWYDPAYFGRNPNNSAATFNPASVPHDRFPIAVRRQQGLDAELLDAFAHVAFDVAGAHVTLRAGRHTLIWGESLFFAGNGIAAAQAPIDFIKQNAVPNTPARELFLPVNQLSAVVQVRPGLSFEAYYQLEWRPHREPGVASYFSTTDLLDAGGERFIAGPGAYDYRLGDRRPGASGQFGIAARATIRDLDLGVYAMRYNAHQAVMTFSGCQGPCGLPGQVGTYRLNYATGISAYGVSASTLVGNDNVAGEVSLRRNVPLLARVDPGAFAVPRGDTAHAQLSIVTERPATALWDRVSVMAELAGNVLLATTTAAAARDPAASRGALAFQGQVTFDYFHVLPFLDLSPFVAVSYGLAGRSSVDDEMVAGAGNVTLGMQATWHNVWHADVRLTGFIGPAARQPLADRSFMSFNIRRTF